MDSYLFHVMKHYRPEFVLDICVSYSSVVQSLDNALKPLYLFRNKQKTKDKNNTKIIAYPLSVRNKTMDTWRLLEGIWLKYCVDNIYNNKRKRNTVWICWQFFVSKIKGIDFPCVSSQRTLFLIICVNVGWLVSSKSFQFNVFLSIFLFTLIYLRRISLFIQSLYLRLLPQMQVLIFLRGYSVTKRFVLVSVIGNWMHINSMYFSLNCINARIQIREIYYNFLF